MRLTKAQIARLRALESGDGRLTPARVVQDARTTRSPLHRLFNWNTKQAAEKYWLHRAREIIGAVTVVITNETTTIRSPVYVHLPEETGYQRVATLRSNPAQARESLIYTLEMASGHLRRALDLASPLGLQDQIDALIVEIVGVQRVIRQAA